MSHRVLIVEGSATSRERMAATVRSMEGVEVISVPSGFEALKLLPRYRFDLILTDATMPDIDGFELANFVKKSPPYRRTPLLVISEHPEEGDRARALLVGASAVLARTIDDEELTSLVRDHLEPSSAATAETAVAVSG